MGSDGGPSPSKLEADTVTLMLEELRQADEETSNTWLQILSSQEEAGIVAEPHFLPEMELE